MIMDEIYYGMRTDTFLADDPIAPFESREVEKTEEEKERLCKRMIEIMKTPQKLPD